MLYPKEVKLEQPPEKIVLTLRELLFDGYTLDDGSSFVIGMVDTQPVGQRLEVTTDTEKSEGIITSIIDNINIGEITVCASPENPEGYAYESIDGGHRKRAIINYITGRGQKAFKVRGLKFRELPQEEQDAILDKKVTVVIYPVLDTFVKGYIFRTLNIATDVNHQEMCNSFGDIDVANVIREAVRVVDGIWNTTHELFERTASGEFKLLEFNNLRLKTDELVARIMFRMTQPKKLGESSDAQVRKMYEEFDGDIDSLKIELYKVLDYLRIMAVIHKQQFGRGLSQQDFKLLTFLFYWLIDEVGTFSIDDPKSYLKDYKKAFAKLTDHSGKYGKMMNPTDIDQKPRFISESFKGYLGAPHHKRKIEQVVFWLLLEFTPTQYIVAKDKKRTYSYDEKVRKLLDQNFICAITGDEVTMDECEAAHIVSHSDGGYTTYDNFVMCRTEHNRAMGSMNLEDYKETYLKNLNK